MKLYEIRAIVEGESLDELHPLVESIESAICPYPPESEHTCPRGWMVVTTQLDPEEAAEWEPALNR
jgi:hypothetical protein